MSIFLTLSLFVPPCKDFTKEQSQVFVFLVILGPRFHLHISGLLSTLYCIVCFMFRLITNSVA
jgi:hypothetical protein